MKRHPALIPLSHDHHHALVQARRLRHAADKPEVAAATASSFLRFFAEQTVPHFREEEELLFPLAISFDEARDLLVEALLQHQRLHALVLQLQQRIERDAADADLMRAVGELLEAHVRLEERELFPLIELLLESDERGALAQRRSAELGVSDQAETDSAPPALHSDDLNVTRLSWKAGTGPPEHVNEERDVLLVILEGSATVTMNDEQHELRRGESVVVAKGLRRGVSAGREGVRYLSVHRRRPPLQIGRLEAERELT